MRILEPAIRLVGRLSFRNKLRATALVFGLPLLLALGIILSGLGNRVSALNHERDALAVQTPALAFLAEAHQYLAARQSVAEGAELEALAENHRSAANEGLEQLRTAMLDRPRLTGYLTANREWLEQVNASLEQAGSTERDELGEIHTRLRSLVRTELERLNERSGLLVDGETSSSRLIDVLTAQIPDLIDTNGQAARLGSIVLITKRFKSSRRTELTVLRGNFNPLVQWGMDVIDKVLRERPDLAGDLEQSHSLLNTAFLNVQEAMTIKMLDSQDFDMTPQEFQALTRQAFENTLHVTTLLQKSADKLLAERLASFEMQRAMVLAAMLLTLGLVLAGFVAAYISIMRGLNSLSDAVNTMASGDLEARVEISTSDEIGTVGSQFNLMVENLAQKTAQLHEKTKDIQTLLQNMPQGILTIVRGGRIHPEYSDYLEAIFETTAIANQPSTELLFGQGSLGPDRLDQIETTLAACIGEDLMNFEFNKHLLVGEVTRRLADDRTKELELVWSPICNDEDLVEKIMVCIRDVSELRKLEAEASKQKRELLMIGQILAVNQEKFHEFVDSARGFIAENEALLRAAENRHPELVTQLFRNMHTIKGNARTYGLLHLTNIVHEAEQAYDELRHNDDVTFEKEALLEQLQLVMQSIEEYASLNEVKLGRKGPGRRGNPEKYVMVQRTQIESMAATLDELDPETATRESLASHLDILRHGLHRMGTETIPNLLDGVFDSMPSLAAELGKENPELVVNDRGIAIRNQAADLLRNVFMHLYRNAMDHGLEKATERMATGKPPVGTISLDASLKDGRLELRLGDDGRGLALAAIRRKAIEKGLLPPDSGATDEAVARLIFAPGFSTASRITEVSGRGVGMDAVQDFIKREGGSIELILTDHCAGAEFRRFETVITLPGRLAVCVPRPLAVLAALPDPAC